MGGDFYIPAGKDGKGHWQSRITGHGNLYYRDKDKNKNKRKTKKNGEESGSGEISMIYGRIS